MPRTTPTQESVYTTVITDALKTAWRDKRYWLLAFFSTVLFTGGAMDILFRTLDDIPVSAAAISSSGTTIQQLATGLSRFNLSPSGLLNAASGLQAIFALAIVLLAILAFAVACQGGLVYAIGAVQRGSHPTLPEALRVGGSAFWPVAVLNILIHGSLWIVRFLAAAAVAATLAGDITTAKQSASIVAFTLAFLFTYAANVVHVFSLNAMMLQGAHLREAIRRSLHLLAEHWFVTVETALLLVIIDLAILFLVFGAYFLIALPFVTAMFTAALIQSDSLFYGGLAAGVITFFGLIFSAAGFTTHLKYAVWTYLYRRLGEGGVIPKLHRIVRQFTKSTRVA